MEIEKKELDDSIVLVFNSDIEVSGMKKMKEELLTTVENNDKDIVIDLSKVNYLDSSGIGVLINISKILKGKGKSLKLINVTEQISRILELSSLNEVLGR